MECPEAIYSKVYDAVYADTGASGLNNSSSTAFMRGLYLSDDPAMQSVTDRPLVVVDIQSRDASPFPGAAGTAEFFENLVSFAVLGDRDESAGTNVAGGTGLVKVPGSLAIVNRVKNRLRAVFQNTTLSALTDADDGTRAWYFSPIARMNASPGPRNDKNLNRIISFRVFVSKGTL